MIKFEIKYRKPEKKWHVFNGLLMSENAWSKLYWATKREYCKRLLWSVTSHLIKQSKPKAPVSLHFIIYKCYTRPDSDAPRTKEWTDIILSLLGFREKWGNGYRVKDDYTIIPDRATVEIRKVKHRIDQKTVVIVKSLSESGLE